MGKPAGTVVRANRVPTGSSDATQRGGLPRCARLDVLLHERYADSIGLKSCE